MAAFVSKQIAVPAHELGENDRECAICTTPFGHLMAEGPIEHAVKLSCGHVFGSVCLVNWLKTSNRCGFCRTELFPQPHQPHDDSLLEEITIADAEARLLEQFERTREPTIDEVDEIEATGSSSSYKGRFRAADSQQIRMFRGASIRRRGDLHILDTYDDVRISQIRGGVPDSERLPDLEPWEIASGSLGWEADLALFNYLQNRKAFASPGFDIVRDSLEDHSDESLYFHLRSTGARWIDFRSGWFLYGNRMNFAGRNPGASKDDKTFDILQKEGAFRTLGITRCFRDVRNLFHDDRKTLTPTDFETWMRINADPVCWHPDLRCWFYDDHSHVAYGDVPLSEELRSEKVWMDSQGRVSCRVDARPEVKNYIANLWLAGQHPEREAQMQ